MSKWTTSTISSHCDLCGKSEGIIESLRSEYATDEIKYLCGDCMLEANKHLDKLRNVSFKWWHLMVKKFLKDKK